MNWQELETFLTLADELHFGRTAEKLHLSRARVSQMTKALERRVGAPLFERTSRRVVLTPLGKQLRDDLDQHHDGILDALARAAELARGETGLLRVGFSSPRASEMVMAAGERFRESRPLCELRIREVHLSDRYGPLRRDELDIQLIEFPVEEPDLVLGPVLLRDPRVIAVSDRHRLADRATVSHEDLAEEKILFIGGVPDYFRDWLIPEHTPSGRPVHRSMIPTFWQELLALVAAGDGITVAAGQGARYYPRPNLVYIPFDDATPVEYGLVWRRSAASTKVMSFVRAAVETAGGAPT